MCFSGHRFIWCCHTGMEKPQTIEMSYNVTAKYFLLKGGGGGRLINYHSQNMWKFKVSATYTLCLKLKRFTEESSQMPLFTPFTEATFFWVFGINCLRGFARWSSIGIFLNAIMPSFCFFFSFFKKFLVDL